MCGGGLGRSGVGEALAKAVCLLFVRLLLLSDKSVFIKVLLTLSLSLSLVDWA